MSFNPSDEKPLSAYTDEELLSFLGIESTLKDVFRNYNMTDEEKREFLLEKAQEKNQKTLRNKLPHFRYPKVPHNC